MALTCFFPTPILQCKNARTRSRRCKPMCSSKSTSMAFTTAEPPQITRRSANYVPSLWSFDHIQSLTTQYTGEDYEERADTLKKVVKTMIRKAGNNPLDRLQLVDDLQRLGISYHFEDEISNVLEVIYDTYFKAHDKWNNMDFNIKVLGFRLLRQHGYPVPQELLRNFAEKTQNHKPHILEDMVEMLNLYEATYHSFENESILDDARHFTTKYLTENQEKINESYISSLVSHALELPLHWRVPRVEAKWFIEVYEKRGDLNPTLVELAKLDFNMVQSIHLEDLKYASRWWKNKRFDEKLGFIRDRLVEHFLWATGFTHLPQFSLGRRTLAKVNSMITTIDDVYDVYGTLDELEQFTNVIHRWDINAMEELPDYMKICFLGFYNTINEITYNTLTDTQILAHSYLTKAWARLCKSYLVEARWYHGGHTPTLKEYLDNAYISISGPTILTHVNFLTSVSSKEEILEFMARADKIVYYSSLILRLADDLGTSSDELARGDTPKSIQCYMHESGATEEEARAYIKNMIMETWKKLNEERAGAKSQFSREFFECATNISRMAQFFYSEGDGHGRPDIIKSHVSSLLFNPI